MSPGTLFTSEAELRVWVDQNLDSFRIRRIILSQEACPDYVLEMIDGRIARVEAELFAVNFRYHRHNPAKVDFLLACYSKTDDIDGMPVVALHKLHVWEPSPVDPIPADAPLTEPERAMLDLLLSTGEVSGALAAKRVLRDGPNW